MLTITTNHTPRFIIEAYELTPVEREEFDYIDFENDSPTFMRYKGHLYDLSEFIRVTSEDLSPWHGYQSESAWSGIVVHFNASRETVIVGQYFQKG